MPPCLSHLHRPSSVLLQATPDPISTHGRQRGWCFDTFEGAFANVEVGGVDVDAASRTPVMIQRTRARAILTGDGGWAPELSYLRGRDAAKEGDLVLTSGDGGVLPRGFAVGRVVRGADGGWRVRLATDAAPIDYVRIVLFEDFVTLEDLRTLSRPSPPPPPTPVPALPVPTPKPAQAKPTQAKPTQAKPTQAKPVQERPTQAAPVQANPTQARPAPPPAPQPAPARDPAA